MRTHGGIMSEVTEENKNVEKTLDEVMKELEESKAAIDALNASKERILLESKEHADKYRKMRDEKLAMEKAELEKSENWKELKEKTEQDLIAEKERSEKMASLMIDKDLKLQVSQLAPNAYDINDVIYQVKNSDKLSLNNESLTFEGVKEAIDEIREKKIYLFKEKTSSSMVNDIPNNKPKEFNINDLTREEKLKLVLERGRK